MKSINQKVLPLVRLFHVSDWLSQVDKNHEFLRFVSFDFDSLGAFFDFPVYKTEEDAWLNEQRLLQHVDRYIWQT